MSPLRRYIYGWQMYVWAFKNTRWKDHGMMGEPLWVCHRMAACMRYLADGQFRNAKGPRFARQWKGGA